ncbi:MAG: glucosyltransferase domain-containing protein [Lachnospiraceae bacterium]|nr:glucosyltransferase domain-containing protein [Lachnospiraceae bacterium]MBP3352627.1 glucosyltransferase domain-containing protein [Lachnospiraceae bacterium]
MKENSAIEDIYKFLRTNIKRKWIVAFLSCFCIGLLTYGYILTHHFLTYDSLWNLYSDQDMISSGRQFLTYVCSISSDYDLPFFNGILAIFYLSITSVFLVEIFHMKSDITIALAAGLLVTFPSVISTFCYTFTIDGYMLALLLATIAFWVTDRKKFGCIPGALLLSISLGIYQAYLSFLMILCVLTLLLYLLKEENYKGIFKKIGNYAIMGVGGYVCYVLSLNGMLMWKGVSMSGYQGTDRINSFSLSQLPEGLKSAFWNFVNFARWGNVLTTTTVMKFAMLLLILGGIALYGYLFLKQGCYKKPLKIVLTIVLASSIPFCATVISIISADTYFHLLMRGAWSLFFIYVLVLLEESAEYKTKKEANVKRITAMALLTCSAVLIFEFAKMANIVGFNMEERYEKSYALSLRIVESLEKTEGYEHGMKVAILGGFPSEEKFPSTEVTKQDLSGYFGADGDYSLNSTSKFAEFMSHYLGVTIQTISQEEEITLTQTEEFAEMQKFPDSGCIRRIGDVWVVKLNG